MNEAWSALVEALQRMGYSPSRVARALAYHDVSTSEWPVHEKELNVLVEQLKRKEGRG